MAGHRAPAHGETGPLPYDTSVAHQARVYDYMLGGKNNYAADRAVVDAAARIWPGAVFTARANRAFLGRAVRYLAGQAGIRQFLDLGTGIPTAGNTHQVAQAIAPDARVAYVDYDPTVLAYARALLTSSKTGATDYIHADIRDPAAVLSQASRLLDLSKPVAVTMLSILHAIGDSDNPHAIVATLMDAMAPGSYLAISHAASDFLSQDALRRLTDLADHRSQQKVVFRTREQVARFFDGTDLVEPGLVRVEEWRPEPGADQASESAWWAAVGRKR